MGDGGGVSDEVGSGPLFVVVSGRPGSGKSTLARQLATALGTNLLVKDTIKQALVDVLGAADVEASRELGRAARHVLTAVAASSTGAVLDSVWPAGDRQGVVDRPSDPPADALRTLPGTLVEVYCDVASELAAQRYREREATRSVESGVVGSSVVESGVAERSEAEQARAGQPVAGGWPVLRVDTSVDVDIAALVLRIRAVGSGRGRQTT